MLLKLTELSGKKTQNYSFHLSTPCQSKYHLAKEKRDRRALFSQQLYPDKGFLGIYIPINTIIILVGLLMILLHGKPLRTRNPEMRVDTSVQIMLNTLLKKHHSEQTRFLEKWVVDVHQCMPIT